MIINTASVYDYVCIYIPGYIICWCMHYLCPYNDIFDSTCIIMHICSYIVGIIFNVIVETTFSHMRRNAKQIYYAISNVCYNDNCKDIETDLISVCITHVWDNKYFIHDDIQNALYNMYDIAYMKSMKTELANDIKVLECQTRLLLSILVISLFGGILNLFSSIASTNAYDRQLYWGVSLVTTILICMIWHNRQIKQYKLVFEAMILSFVEERDRIMYIKMLRYQKRKCELG